MLAAASTTAQAQSLDLDAARTLTERYCHDCHNYQDWAGGLALDTLDMAHVEDDPEIWERVVRKLRTGMMPPLDAPRPDRQRLDGIAAALETQLDAGAAVNPMPGRPGLRRLNRTEYRNVIRDLLDFDVDVATLLPPDNSIDGFDNIAAGLSVSPLLVQSYASAAMKISRQAVGDRAATESITTYSIPSALDQSVHIDGLPLGTRGGMRIEHTFPLDAEYDFAVRGGGFRGFGGSPIDVTLDGQRLGVNNTRRFRLPVKAGPHVLTVAVVEQRRTGGVDGVYADARGGAGVQSLEITGPFNAAGPGDTPSRRRIFVCSPDTTAGEATCAREIIATLAQRAFRQPPDADTLDPLLAFYAEGRREGSFETGIQQALARILIDPRFLIRFEEEPDDLAAGAAFAVSDLELASRLSFFLWSSIPDDELLQLAAAGELRAAGVLNAQIERMLADARAGALIENFAGQWLYLRELETLSPESVTLDENLRRALKRETELLFADILHEDRSVVELLAADYTYVNQRLAEHYGVAGVRGSYFRRIDWPADSPRRGLLGHGSLLAVTSVPTRTSPVIRGMWVLENLLGAPVPVPPPNVETNLEPDPETSVASSLRARLEAHRAAPVCASCHAAMDPIGLALENFDLLGGWRDTDGGVPIDASAHLIDGTVINGPVDLHGALLERSDQFVTTATEKLLMYALGRSLEYYDMPVVRSIVRDAAAEDYRISAIVSGIVHSVPFQMRAKASPDDAANAVTTKH